jgi:hypothetical protein
MLQQRQKWNKTRRNICVGDVVIVKEDNVNRNNWCMGRVLSTECDDQRNTRSVMLKTMNGALRRPITKLVMLLHIEEQ